MYLREFHSRRPANVGVTKDAIAEAPPGRMYEAKQFKTGEVQRFQGAFDLPKGNSRFLVILQGSRVLRGLRYHVESYSSTLSHPVTLGFHGSIHESRDKVFCTHSRCHLEQPQKSPINSQALITIFNGGRQGEEMTTHWSWQLRISRSKIEPKKSLI